jgi:hypothetical protein
LKLRSARYLLSRAAHNLAFSFSADPDTAPPVARIRQFKTGLMF